MISAYILNLTINHVSQLIFSVYWENDTKSDQEILDKMEFKMSLSVAMVTTVWELVRNSCFTPVCRVKSVHLMPGNITKYNVHGTLQKADVHMAFVHSDAQQHYIYMYCTIL